MRLSFVFAFLFCFTLNLVGQGLVLTPLNKRMDLIPNHAVDRSLFAANDTLLLPFFEDFTSGSGYPNALLWKEKQVWVNNTFCKNPPNFNAATFDHLNEKGQPYSTLNKNEMVFADSLTSYPIKLDKYKTGPSTTANYQVSDSIILSFFYQQKGNGDLPESEDSLILFFKNNSNKWVQVWSKSGSVLNDFTLVQIGILKPEFLHNAFQFRFVNYTKATGNLNHWNLDYIRLEKYKNRSGGNDIVDISDVGIVNPDYFIFKKYHSLPYAHFKTNPAAQLKDKLSITVRNLNTAASKTTQTRFGLKVFNQYNTLVFQQLPASNSRNILFNSDSTVQFNAITLDTFSGKNPFFNLTYYIEPQSNDKTPDAYNAIGNNNEIQVKHEFTPWYAYDDGSAEGGFGLDYSFLGNVKGQFAMKFDNLKDDSLRGMAIYFNRSESDVSFRSFYIRIWKSISEIGKPDDKDVLLYEQLVTRPAYTDSINHFTYIFFDTVLALPQGSFYAGWRQNQPFILNVGYDNNYRWADDNTGNPNLFNNLLGSWERSDYDIKGVPMIRPLLGAPKDYSFATKSNTKQAFAVHPNPVMGSLHWSPFLQQGQLRVFDFTGRVVFETSFTENTADISTIKSGTYFAIFTGNNGEYFKTQIIKQ